MTRREDRNATANDEQSLNIRRYGNRYVTVTLREGELWSLSEALDAYRPELDNADYDPEDLDILRDRIAQLRAGLPKLPPVKDA